MSEVKKKKNKPKIDEEGVEIKIETVEITTIIITRKKIGRDMYKSKAL